MQTLRLLSKWQIINIRKTLYPARTCIRHSKFKVYHIKVYPLRLSQHPIIYRDQEYLFVIPAIQEVDTSGLSGICMTCCILVVSVSTGVGA